ncbi:hypothetical protein P9W96_31975, partial [Bacillus cereus]|nr:hypothetical protein [Bacillus cereus]
MRKIGLITALFILLFSSFTGCDHSPKDKNVNKEQTKRTEKEKGPKLKNKITETFNQSISQVANKKALAMDEIIKSSAVNTNLDLYISF